jgi:hypothetical protein
LECGESEFGWVMKSKFPNIKNQKKVAAIHELPLLFCYGGHLKTAIF